MKILAIETSCDETSATVVENDENGVRILSNIVASSMELHSKTGGIIPETAAREQVKYIIPVIAEALEKAGLHNVIPAQAGIHTNKGTWIPGQARDDGLLVPNIDSIAVTYGPGLIGSLLVGVETAKTLSFVWEKPLIPVNHLFGHIYANWLKPSSAIPTKAEIHKDKETWIPGQARDDELNIPQFPLIALIVSGGHTDLLLMKSHTDITWLGGTRDDAAGECFDKSGRLLGLSYPAGPEIEQRAKLGNPKAYHFPRPLLHDNAYDFSFSGLKTAVLREVEKLGLKERGGASGGRTEGSLLASKAQTSQEGPARVPAVNDSERSHRSGVTSRQDPVVVNDICRGLQDAISDVLVTKTMKAAEECNVKSVLLSGGVAANQTLKAAFTVCSSKLDVKLFVPPKSLCTDNAAMIGAAALFQNRTVDWNEVSANPELYFD